MFRPAITPLTIASVATAVLACALPWLFYGSHILGLAGTMNLILWPPVIWLVITVAALVKHKGHAMWLLLGAPVALFDFVYFALTFSPCDPTGTRCL